MLRSRAALIQRRDEQNREARRVGGRTCSGEALSCSLFAEGSRQGHFFLRFRLNCTRCISIAPATLDRYLAALPAMCSSTDTRATVRPTGFHQNDVVGFPRPTRHSLWPPAVKFAPCEPY